MSSTFEFDSAVIRLAERYFAILGEQVRLNFDRLQATWIRLALGFGTVDRIFAVVLGYAVVGLLLALYLNILTVGNVKSAGRAARSAVRQQLLVLKVYTFQKPYILTFNRDTCRLLCSLSSSSLYSLLDVA